MPELPFQKLFVLLFMMTGPLKVVPSFAHFTRGIEANRRNRIARRAIVFAAAGVILAVFVGFSIMKSWGASPQALAAATGILLLITAIQSLIGWPSPVQSQNDDKSDRIALSPVAFPTILPPFAVGVLILFGAYFPNLNNQLKMIALAFLILILDLIAMRYADQIMNYIGSNVLQVLGAVFGVLQLSLAIQMLFWSFGIPTTML
ncbi:MAG: MarC family protein [Zavarzinella sp.]